MPSVFSSLVDSSALRWQNALLHLQRSLIECGSNFELEHAQRLGLLFSTGVGKAASVNCWASLFSAEAVPTSALMLRALVKHDSWLKALEMIEEDMTSTRTRRQLEESVAQFLVENALWKQSLEVLLKAYTGSDSDTEVALNGDTETQNDTMPALQVMNSESSSSSSHAEGCSVSSQGSSAWLEENSRTDDADEDGRQLAHNPLYLPREARKVYCTVGSAVCMAFPQRENWSDAVSVLSLYLKVASDDVKPRILDYIVAKWVYSGHCYEAYLRWLDASATVPRTEFLTRAALHSSFQLGRIDSCVTYISSLSNFNPKFMDSHNVRQIFTALMSRHDELSTEHIHLLFTVAGRYLTERGDENDRDAFVRDITLFFAEYGLTLETAANGVRPVPSTASVGNNALAVMDDKLTHLVRSQRWEEALVLLRTADQYEALSDKDRIIQQMATSTDWQRALLFFS